MGMAVRAQARHQHLTTIELKTRWQCGQRNGQFRKGNKAMARIAAELHRYRFGTLSGVVPYPKVPIGQSTNQSLYQ